MSTQMYRLRPTMFDDWNAVRRIYLEGLATGDATFETTAPNREQWDATHYAFARVVLASDSEVIGWAALSPISARRAYAGVAEVSVYVSNDARGAGHGRTLLEALIQAAEQNGIWTLQASIFPENLASINLHLRCGFREIGRRERIAKLNDVWRDTVLLERRSTVIGLR